MTYIKKGNKKPGAEDTKRTAKDKLGYNEEELLELKDVLSGVNKLEELIDLVKSKDWKQRCTLLFELIYQHFDGRETAEALISHEVINYAALEVTEDFKELFEAIQAKHPGMDVNSSVNGYLSHVKNLIKEEIGFEYPDEILYTAGKMIIGKVKGFIN